MTHLRRDLAWLFLLALGVRLLAAWPQQQPNYMDAAYSYVNAANLAAGRGFVEDFVWNYLDNPDPPPHPSHLYWMPLTSILAWLGMAVGGVSYRAAQIPFVILSAALAPMGYWAARALGGGRRQAWLAGLLAIFSGFYFPFWTAIDNFTPFAVAGSLALLLGWLGINAAVGVQKSKKQGQPAAGWGQSSLCFLAAGIFVGLAHLSRADGSLLLVAIILTGPAALAQNRAHAVRRGAAALAPWACLVLGYGLTMLPWLVRNWQAAGTLLSAAGSQTIWLADYDDLFSYGRELSARTFLAQGIGPILRGRWWALTANLQTVLAVWGMIFLAPLALVGGWTLRRHILIQLVSLYALLLFLAMTLVFAFPGARGGLFHSGAAVLPFVCAAAVIGLDSAVDWAAARRRHWNGQQAKQVFGVGLGGDGRGVERLHLLWPGAQEQRLEQRR